MSPDKGTGSVSDTSPLGTTTRPKRPGREGRRSQALIKISNSLFKSLIAFLSVRTCSSRARFHMDVFWAKERQTADLTFKRYGRGLCVPLLLSGLERRRVFETYMTFSHQRMNGEAHSRRFLVDHYTLCVSFLSLDVQPLLRGRKGRGSSRFEPWAQTTKLPSHTHVQVPVETRVFW